MTDFRLKLQNAVRGGRWFATRFLRHPTIVSSLLITSVIFGIRQLSGLQSLELLTFDQMTRWRPDAGPDSRLLIVTITEEDIRQQNRWPLSDESVAQLLATLQQYRPRAIGLDLYRDVPHPPGNAALLEQLRRPNVISIQLLESAGAGGVSPPRGVPETQIGFSDFLVDPDATIRRNFLFAATKTERWFSFSLRSSLRYLAADNQQLQVTPTSLQIGTAVFTPLTRTSGGYEALDDRGYQVLLNYRSAANVARQVTLTQVLSSTIPADWVTDKLVLIGTTAPSAKDLFLTPHNFASDRSPSMPGVLVHAQMASQILSVVLDGQPLVWFWSEAGELGWIWAWSIVGG
ncbi:CHASE2 domain-containing protein, partial [Leptolyngbya sp. FACHB-36]|uniref:CHASE2 domain-containing protein n=1 Tax=Leptolyngbya sp. FACHB-36 TaxID=2692808 RepID=UPI001680E640